MGGAADAEVGRRPSRHFDDGDDRDDETHRVHDNGVSNILTWKVVAAVVLFRCFNALVLATYFNPDEYWQSLEMAHTMAFGCGAEPTWEWQPNAQLRGYLHPFIFAVLFKLLQVTRLDSRLLVIAVPRLFQGILAAVCDLCIVRTVESRSRGAGGDSLGKWTLFITLSSWFNFYCLPRTFSNSMETVLTTAGLCSLYGQQAQRRRKIGAARVASAEWDLVPGGAVLCAALATALRPTAIVLWMGVAFSLVLFEDGWASVRRIAASLVWRAVPAMAAVLLVRSFVTC